MDKIKLLDLGVLPEITATSLQIGDATVEVTPRIPYEDVLDMIQWCIDFIINDRPFVSEPLKQIIKNFAILKYYTNLDISFVEEFRAVDEIYENYDIVDRYGIVRKVRDRLDNDQIEFFDKTLDATLNAIAAYRNSAKGILDAITEHSKEDVQQMQEALEILGDDEQNAKIANLLKFTEGIQG